MRALPLLLALLAVPTTAHAFAAKETSRGAHVHFRDRRVVLIADQAKKAERDALLLKAATSAAQAWSEPGEVDIEVRQGAREVGFIQGGDNENVIAFDDDRWDFDGDMLAVSLVHFDVATGEIFDADIVINTDGYTWADKAEHASVDAYDLANTLTHELGHVVGLAHSTTDEATMFPTSGKDEVTKRDLADDDVQGLTEIYGTLGAPATPEPGASTLLPPGCSSTGAPGLAALLLVPALFLRRRRALVGCALLTAAALGAPGVARADPPSLARVLSRADRVLEGTVIRQEVRRNAHGLLVTISTLRVDRCLVGACGAMLELEQLGGELDGVGLAVEGITPLSPAASVTIAVRQERGRTIPVLGDAGILADHRISSQHRLEGLRAQIFSARR